MASRRVAAVVGRSVDHRLQCYAFLACISNHEREQILGRTIDPVHILDDQQHRLALGEPCEDRQDRLEQLLPAAGRACARSQSGPQGR